MNKTEYAAWVTVDGEQWDGNASNTAAERDQVAEDYATQMRAEFPDRSWSVWVGESTPTSAITPETSRLYERS